MQCIPISKMRKVEKITESKDLVYDYDPLVSPAMPQYVPSGSNTNITYRNISSPWVAPHYNVDMKAVNGSNLALDAKMTLPPLPSGTTGFILDFSFVEANHPTVTGSNRTLIAKGNLGVEIRNTSRPGYEGESLVLTWVNGSGSARLVVPPGKVLPTDVLRVWMHYDAPPLPASLPTSTYAQQAKFTYTSVVTNIVKPVDQQYVTLSCDTDGAYAATYRFGFNGQQKDDEIAGKGNSLDFQYRGYDSRLGRFRSIDPLSNSYPWNSVYAFAENRVIDCIDLEGKESFQSITQQRDNSSANVPMVCLTTAQQNAQKAAQGDLYILNKSQSQKTQKYYNGTNGSDQFSQDVAEANLRFGAGFVPGGTLAIQAVAGEEITNSDIRWELASILPIGKLFKLGSNALKVSAYAFKHVAREGVAWKKIVESTIDGPAKFIHGTNVEQLTKEAWDNGIEVTNAKPWKVYKTEGVLGAYKGRETNYMRVELTESTKELHASPISEQQYKKLTKSKPQ